MRAQSRVPRVHIQGGAGREGEDHVYFKPDTTVAENDKSWASFVKRPAGLMDVSFKNDLPFPLELCWIDMVGTASPACYGTVACCGGTKNMSSFAGHNFVLKRLVWSLPAAAAAGSTPPPPTLQRQTAGYCREAARPRVGGYGCCLR